MLLRTFTVVLVLLSAMRPSGATIIHIPGDLPTIQAGLDSSANGDTVAVAIGTYAEALMAPPRTFVLKGDVVPDTGEYPRPIIDPSSLPGSDSLACLLLPAESRVVIEDFKFRNGPEMFPRSPGHGGGIISRADALTLRRCLLDTLSQAVSQIFGYGDTTMVIENCQFRGDTSWCIQGRGCAWMLSNCTFSGAGYYLAGVGAHSRISNCQFEHNGTGGEYMLQPVGVDIRVENCVFGPDDDPEYGIMFLVSRMSGKIVNNVFMNSAVQNALHIYVSQTDTIEVAHNIFTNLQPGSVQAGTPIKVEPQDPTGGSLSIHDNVFTNCSSLSAPSAIQVTWAEATIERNHFSHLAPPQVAAVDQFVDWGVIGDVIMRDNLFSDVGLAAYGTGQLDARWNWWGDSTGPYHAFRNPLGQGEEVQGNLMFDPWYPDTTFLAAPEPHAPFPQSASLDVFPNPFNNDVRLTLTVAHPGQYLIELFDVLGRKVRAVWDGTVVDSRKVVISLADVGSGVYFAQARETTSDRPVATAKLMLVK